MDGDPSVAEQVDDSGTIPLHQAIEFRCPIEVVRALCDNPTTVLSTNRVGCTSVHIALKHRMRPNDLVHTLVQTCPQVVHCRNKAGVHPLDLVYSRYLKCVESPNRHNAKEASMWQTLVLILRAYICGTVNEEDEADTYSSSILHMMVQTNVPYQIVDKTLDRYPNAIRELDAKASCLPIFHLVSSAARDRDAIMTTMITKYPESTKVKDAKGNLLLVAAAQHTLINAQLFCEIVAANPSAIEIPDSITGLYPFMLAATPKAIASNPDTQHHFSKRFAEWGFVSVQNQDRRQLDAVYTLLREGPQLISILL